MGDELFAKVPNHVILTKEFDMSRWGTELYAKELMKHNKLLDMNYEPGESHMSFKFGPPFFAALKFMTKGQQFLYDVWFNGFVKKALNAYM